MNNTPDPTTTEALYAASHIHRAMGTDESDTPVSIAAQLAQQCQKSRQTKRGWQACCPAHEDENPSLSITPTPDRVLLKCHAGCTAKAIVEAVGWTMRDLFAAPRASRPRILKVYDYHAADGTLVHQTVRYADKTFLQRQPHPTRPGQYQWDLDGVQPVLYRLPQVMTAIQAGELVYIVEGEKDADTLSHLGLTATCNPMGAGQWRETYNTTLAGAHCIILPDNDAPGRTHGEQVARALQGIAASVKVLLLPDLPDKGDVSDWVQAGHTLDELRQVVETTACRLSSYFAPGKIDPEDPHEIRPERFSSLSSLSSYSEWPEMAPEAFYGVAATLVETLKDHTEASPIALLLQMLTYYGTVLGRQAYFQVEATRHYSNLFTCLVGPTGKGRKGTAYDHVEHYMHNTDTSWSLLHNVTGGCGSGEGLIYAVRNPVMKREPIRNKGSVTGYEQVMTDEGVIDKRLLVYESEFAGVLKVAGRDGNLLSVILRQAWDSGNLRNTVKGSPLCATNAHISIIGHVTIDELKRYLTDDDMSNGFANRFLFPLVQRSKPLPEGGNLQEVNVRTLINLLKEKFAEARQVTVMTRDPEAIAIWKAVYEPLSEGKPGLVGSLLARGEAQVLRLSMLYALLDGTAMIGKDHLNAALAVWQYCEDSARYIFGTSIGDKQADTLLKDLQEHHPNGRSRKTILEETFKRNLRADELDRLIDLLEKHRLLTKQNVAAEPRKDQPKGAEASKGRGRPKQLLFAKPYELNEQNEFNQPSYLSLSNDAISKMGLSSYPLRANYELNPEDPASDDQLTADISALDALLGADAGANEGNEEPDHGSVP